MLSPNLGIEPDAPVAVAAIAAVLDEKFQEAAHLQRDSVMRDTSKARKGKGNGAMSHSLLTLQATPALAFAALIPLVIVFLAFITVAFRYGSERIRPFASVQHSL